MKKLVFILLAAIVTNVSSYGGVKNPIMCEKNDKISFVNLQSQDSSVWCNSFTLYAELGNDVIGHIGGSTVVNFCCVALLWQTCFNPRPAHPDSYYLPILLTDLDDFIGKEVETKDLKEIEITKSNIVEIAKGEFYTIESGIYRIQEKEEGKYVDFIMKKVKQ